MTDWNPWAEPAGLASITVGEVELHPGDRVRLRPRRTADILDLALSGRIAVIESIEQDFEDRIHLAVVVEDDPGGDLGMQRLPGHRFFFSPDDVEPLGSGGEGRHGT